ncbi:hypothetical protein M0R45_026930 [Rubus argutus]|uniref:Uncharacterized protein n=1 Tax=Rubus argutus TaxID=59490 RepID=A0AAW1WYS6_RUBAR
MRLIHVAVDGWSVRYNFDDEAAVKRADEAHTCCSGWLVCEMRLIHVAVDGWSVRYNFDDVAAVKRADEAHNDMLKWFVKHVK